MHFTGKKFKLSKADTKQIAIFASCVNLYLRSVANRVTVESCLGTSLTSFLLGHCVRPKAPKIVYAEFGMFSLQNHSNIGVAPL